MALASGTGPLLGTTNLDIGTNAANGLISFTDLGVDSAGTNKQLLASATGLTSALSSIFTVVKASQAITFGPLPNMTYGDPPFTVGATASSGLPVSFSVLSGPATLSGNTLTISGAGTVTVRASQSGDANWAAATPVDQPFIVAKASQTITFGALANKAYGDSPSTLSATASSGLAVSFNIVSGPATVSGNTLTMTGAGAVTVRASQPGDTNWNAATLADQSFTVAKASQTITFGPLPNKTYGDSPSTLNATASSGLAVTFSVLSGPATISGNTLTLTGAGTVTVRASQSGDTNWNAATPADRSFTVAKGSQTITLGALADKNYGDAPLALSATASSGLAVSFSVISGPATISGNTLTLTGAGAVTVRASQPGDTNWNAASPADQSFTVGKASQTITFGALADKTYGDSPSTLSATASSGLAVSFSVLSGPATISSNTLTLTGAGAVTVRATQSGDTNWNAATTMDQSFTVAKASQTISFGPLADKTYSDPPNVAKANQNITFGSLPNKTYGDAPFTLSAITSSGLTVGFSVLSGPATVSGNTLTLTGAGVVTMRASQSGDTNWNAATSVDQSFNVAKASQTITFGPLSNKTYGDAPFTLSATASSGLAVSFSVVSGPATVSGNTLALTGAGTVTVRATQSGDTNWNAASPVYQFFNVAKANQTITFNTLPDKTYGDAPFTLSASASSGLAVSFSVVSGPATVSGSTLTLSGVGTVTVRASQPGDTNWNPATPADQPFTVAKGSQTITFGPLGDKNYGDAPLALSATASSDLPVSFSVLSGPGTVSGNTLTITGPGTVTVRASQPGDTNWNAASPADQSFTVAKGSQTITFGPLADKSYGDAPVILSATASSGLAVSFSVLSGPATISSNTLTLTGAGVVTVRATQSGDTNWNAATTMDQSFTVAKASQTISFGPLADKTYSDPPGHCQTRLTATRRPPSMRPPPRAWQ